MGRVEPKNSRKEYMILKTNKEIEIMTEGGKILAEIMNETKKQAVPGVSTKHLDLFTEKLIKRKKGKPSFKGYNNFPAAICTSVNEVLVHGVPSDYILQDGDILSIDIGFLYKGFHTDMAVTVAIGEVDDEVARLVRETKKGLKRGIKKTKIGNTLGDVGNTIMRYAEKSGFFVADGLCGHGIGRDVHESPQVLNTGKRRKGADLAVGLVFCIEPMFIIGDSKIEYCSDGIGIKSKNNSHCAHFEHTIALTERGTRVLTEI